MKSAACFAKPPSRNTGGNARCRGAGLPSRPFTGSRPKLTVGRANDPAERQADELADRALAGRPRGRSGDVQRTAHPGASASEARGNVTGLAAPPAVQRLLAEPGRSLDPAARRHFEERFQRSFADVRVHDGESADSASRQIHAQAFTAGSHIAFARGQYRPGDAQGRRLLAHELAHVVQQSPGGPTAPNAGASVVRRAPAPAAKSAEDERADRIDHHPAWGSWPGGSGSVEGYQEMEANLTFSDEGGFYESREFRAWYFYGWRGLAKLEHPDKALQMVAAVLIPDAAARKKFFSDINAPTPSGNVAAASSALDEARRSGSIYDPGRFIAAMGTAIALDQAQSTGNFDEVDFFVMANGRDISKSFDLWSFERFTIDGVEVAPSSFQKVNDELVARKESVEPERDFTWLGADAKAGQLTTPSKDLAKNNKIPKKALGGIFSLTYRLSDGRVLRRENWHHIAPDGDYEKGNRSLRFLWSQYAIPPGLPMSDTAGLMMIEGELVASRMNQQAKFGSFKPVKPAKPARVKAGKMPAGEEGEAGAPPVKAGKAPPTEEGHANNPPAAKAPAQPQGPRAILPGGKSIPPDSHSGGYHGTTVPPEVAMKSGLPARGDNWDLQNHAEELWHYQPAGKQVNDSAYRGTTSVQSDPVNQSGAAYFAGEGNYVYEIRGVPTWDVNKSLQGQVRSGGNYRGNLMHGEGEYAIPAQVAPDKIVRWGVVKSDRAGRLFVEWHK